MSYDRLPDIPRFKSARERFIDGETAEFSVDDVARVSVGVAEVVGYPGTKFGYSHRHFLESARQLISLLRTPSR